MKVIGKEGCPRGEKPMWALGFYYTTRKTLEIMAAPPRELVLENGKKVYFDLEYEETDRGMLITAKAPLNGKWPASGRLIAAIVDVRDNLRGISFQHHLEVGIVTSDADIAAGRAAILKCVAENYDKRGNLILPV